MRSTRNNKREILTIKDLLKYSNSCERKNIKTNNNIRYVDLSPPSDEISPLSLNSFEYWKRGRKEEYELKYRISLKYFK